MTGNAIMTRNSLPRRWAIQPIQLTALLSAFVLLGLAPSPAGARTVSVAVVRDGPSAEDALVSRIEAELEAFVSVDRTLSFKRDPAFDAAWDLARVPGAVQAALDDHLAVTAKLQQDREGAKYLEGALGGVSRA